MATSPPSNHHHHHQVPAAGPLRIRSHTPRDLVEAAIASFADPNVQSARLKSWLEEFNELIEDHSMRGSKKALDKLKEGARIASELCFLDSVGDLDIEWDEYLLDDYDDFGQTVGVGDDVEIFIDPAPWSDDWIDEYVPFSLVETLVHELGHAMLMKYSCENESCGDESCHALYDLETCEHGHGNAWLDLLSAIQESSERLFGIELDFKLDRYERR